MAYTQLQGRVFNYRGESYIVTRDNDWSASHVRVKRVNAQREISEMPLAIVLECVNQPKEA